MTTITYMLPDTGWSTPTSTRVCKVCGADAYPVVQFTNKEKGTAEYMCDPCWQDRLEELEIEQREFFLDEHQRKIVAAALQVAAYHERDSKKFEELMALSDYLDPQH